MAGRLGKAILYLAGDDTALKGSLNGAKKHTEGWLSSLGGSMKTAIGTGLGFLGAQVVGAGIGALKNELGGLITAAQDAQRVEAQLDAVLASTGGTAGVTKKQILEMADALSKTTPIEDDTIAATSAMLLTFTNVGKDTFPGATEAILDMATAMNQGATPSAEQLKSQALLVGKALNDPIKGLSALTRVGVNFTEEQKNQIKAMVEAGNVAGAQKIILAELGKEFGGSAAAAGKTFAGQMQILNNQVGNFKESVGLALLPLLTQFASAVAPVVISVLEGIAAELPRVIGFLSGMATQTQGVQSALALVVAWVVANWPQVQATIIETWQQVQTFAAPLIAALQSIVFSVFTAISVFLQAHGDEIRSFLQNAWAQIQLIFSVAVQIIQATIIPAFQTIAAFLQAHGAEIQQLLGGTWNIISGIIQVALDLIGGILQTALAIFKGDWSGAWATVKATAQFVWADIEQVFNGAIASITAILKAFNLAEIGTDLINGLWEGIKSGWATLLKEFGALVELLPAAVKKVLGIASPSTVFAGIGENMAAGLGVGFTAGLGGLQANLSAQMSGLGGLRPQLAGAGAGTTNNISITINAPGGDPARVQSGVVQAFRQMGLN